jgi:hypothetical protein
MICTQCLFYLRSLKVPFRRYSSEARSFFEDLGKKLEIRKPEDWYSVSPQDILKNGGEKLLRGQFGNDHIKAICTSFPEIKWDTWKFQRGIGKTIEYENQKKIMEEIAKKLNIQSLEHWYKVSVSDFLNHVC